jgi:hypothetical protein
MAGNPLSRADYPNMIPAENGESAEAGTALANYRDTPSCHVAPAKPCQPSTWGGARNRADRTSDRLSDKQVAGLIESAAYAFATGRVFQRHWTVHYGLAGIKPSHGARFVSHLLDTVTKQARREGGRMTALWVRECASRKGEHVHILLHLPAGMKLRNCTRHWIIAAGGNWRRGVSKMRSVGGRLSNLEESSKARQVANAANVVQYVLKSAEQETGRMLGLTQAGRLGLIVGKRCGWTQNIGKSARAALSPKDRQRIYIP